MAQVDTKTRILDCAERMFAREGFHNTSLRKLTSRAKVNLASVNYHFGSKEALLQAVIERRLLPLNRIREDKITQVLNKAQQHQTRPAAGDLLRAFIEPTLDFSNSSPGARDFIALIGRSWSEPDETVRNCFLELVVPMFQLFYESLCEALPQLPPSILVTRLQFIMGTMSYAMCMNNRPTLNNQNFPDPLNQDDLIQQLLKFVIAGLEVQP